MSNNIGEIRRLLREADEILSPARRGEALHPIVPISMASNRVRDALFLLEREPTDPAPSYAVWNRLQRMAAGYFG